MKSLEQILRAKEHDKALIAEALPGATENLSSVMRQSLQIDGFFLADMVNCLFEGGLRVTDAQVRHGLKDFGWESVSKMIPGRKERVFVWVKKGGNDD